MKNFAFLLLLPLFILTACNKDDDAIPYGEEPPKQYAQLEFTVQICEDNPCTALVPFAGAKIYLYESAGAQEEGTDFVFEGTSGADGKFTFALLDEPSYWYTVTLPQPDGRTQKGMEDTPARSKTFVPIDFEQK